MKHRFFKRAVCVIAASLLMLSGCQPMPDKPAVIQKDMEEMIEKAQQSSSQTNDTQSLKEKMNIPDQLTTELTSEKGRLKVHVDARINLPDINEMPTVKIGMSTFSQDDVKRLYDTLCGNAMPIDPNSDIITQAFKMRSIQDILEQKNAGKLDKYESEEEFDLAIKKTMQEAANLPEHFTRSEPDFSFKSMNNGGTRVYLRVAPNDETISDLSISNAQEGIGQSQVEYCRDISCSGLYNILNNVSGAFLETESPYFQPPTISEDAARKLANDTIAALGLKDFVCSVHRLGALYNPGIDEEDAPRKGVYEYMFTRQIGDVSITYTNDDGNVMEGIKGEAPSMIPAWYYEKVRIIIDEQGVLSLRWYSPYIVTNIITNASAMLPYEDIQNTFEKMIPVFNNFYDYSDQGVTCDMYVTEVRLGLMRITEKNRGTSALVIPVWDFMGYTNDSQNGIDGKDGYRSLLTINAIDGSIIDRALGY